MNIAATVQLRSASPVIHCIDMHTTGEPTRIVYSGFPPLHGETLLDKRDYAQTHHDDVRKRLMLEPRGHGDMYGAVLVEETELTRSGEAHIGVLFTHAGGWSTMCGHATIALARFLVDTTHKHVFTRGPPENIELDQHGRAMILRIHAPCGVVSVTVPLKVDGIQLFRSDPTKSISFWSTPGYAAAIGIEIDIPNEIRWDELGEKTRVMVDISYGGAFYTLVEAKDMGFTNGLAGNDRELKSLAAAARKLKAYLSTHPAIKHALRRAEDERLSFLYSVMVVDSEAGYRPDGCEGTETGLCFFGDSDQIDRSPTGSCVTARMALAHAKGTVTPGQRRAYNSLVSNRFKTGAFVGTIVKELEMSGPDGDSWPAVIVQVEGNAHYTGALSFVHEKGDVTGEAGFTMGI